METSVWLQKSDYQFGTPVLTCGTLVLFQKFEFRRVPRHLGPKARSAGKKCGRFGRGTSEMSKQSDEKDGLEYLKGNFRSLNLGRDRRFGSLDTARVGKNMLNAKVTFQL